MEKQNYAVKKIGHHARLREGEHLFHCQGKSLTLCTCTFESANDTKVMRRRDAQCITEESP